MLLDTTVKACPLKDQVTADLEKVYELAGNGGVVLLFVLSVISVEVRTDPASSPLQQSRVLICSAWAAPASPDAILN